MPSVHRLPKLLFTAVLASVALAQPGLAYIGPGAGFAAAGSLLVLAGTFLLAMGIILIWPFKAVIPATALLLMIQGVSELLKSIHAVRTGKLYAKPEKIEI